MNVPMDFWRRGDIVWVNLDPVIGREQNKTRPAIIVSNDGANRAAMLADGTITVVPLTSNTQRVLPFHALIEAVGATGSRVSKAQAEQIRTVSVRRIVRQDGFANAEAMAALDEALRTHLSL